MTRWLFTRKGDSLLARSPGAHVGLFLISAPSWWLFELINRRTHDWYYEGRHYFNDLQYFVLASLDFSTIMPAVSETAESVSTFNWMKRIKHGTLIVPKPAMLLALFATGCLVLVLLLPWPSCFFPFVWTSVYFVVEPPNVWLANRSVIQYTVEGDSRPVLALWAGCLICGFFWELWNFYSYPR